MTAINFYIDGFNLYYGSLKTRWPEYKWLDIQAFCEGLANGRAINRIRYFTARVKNNTRNPNAADKQQVYLRALATLPKVEIHYGKFTVRDVMLPLTDNPSRERPAIVKVIKTEEKRSDVNLATWLLLDCSENVCGEVVVISNDADLLAPVEAARDRFDKVVGVINPLPAKFRSKTLADAASWSYQTINRSYFANSQFPPRLKDAKGWISKPSDW